MKGSRYHWLAWVACALWVAVIFRQSAMVAEASNVESRGLLSWVVQVLPFMTHHLLRKLAHFCEFAVLGCLLALAFKKYSFYALLVGLLCALSDETIQLFVPGRSGQVSDVWLDFGGIATGVLAGTVLIWLFSRHRT